MSRVIRFLSLLFCFFLVCVPASRALPKPHVIAFGKWTAVNWYVGPPADDQAVELKIRPLYVDTRLREFTTGLPHEVTDRLFVVRRVFRLNDALPEEGVAAPRWQWQRGGWLMVDRITGRITQVSLPEFDPYYSSASWNVRRPPGSASLRA